MLFFLRDPFAFLPDRQLAWLVFTILVQHIRLVVFNKSYVYVIYYSYLFKTCRYVLVLNFFKTSILHFTFYILHFMFCVNFLNTYLYKFFFINLLLCFKNKLINLSVFWYNFAALSAYFTFFRLFFNWTFLNLKIIPRTCRHVRGIIFKFKNVLVLVFLLFGVCGCLSLFYTFFFNASWLVYLLFCVVEILNNFWVLFLKFYLTFFYLLVNFDVGSLPLIFPKIWEELDSAPMLVKHDIRLALSYFDYIREFFDIRRNLIMLRYFLEQRIYELQIVSTYYYFFAFNDDICGILCDNETVYDLYGFYCELIEITRDFSVNRRFLRVFAAVVYPDYTFFLQCSLNAFFFFDYFFGIPMFLVNLYLCYDFVGWGGVALINFFLSYLSINVLDLVAPLGVFIYYLALINYLWQALNCLLILTLWDLFFSVACWCSDIFTFVEFLLIYLTYYTVDVGLEHVVYDFYSYYICIIFWVVRSVGSIFFLLFYVLYFICTFILKAFLNLFLICAVFVFDFEFFQFGFCLGLEIFFAFFEIFTSLLNINLIFHSFTFFQVYVLFFAQLFQALSLWNSGVLLGYFLATSFTIMLLVLNRWRSGEYDGKESTFIVNTRLKSPCNYSFYTSPFIVDYATSIKKTISLATFNGGIFKVPLIFMSCVKCGYRAELRSPNSSKFFFNSKKLLGINTLKHKNYIGSYLIFYVKTGVIRNFNLRLFLEFIYKNFYTPLKLSTFSLFLLYMTCTLNWVFWVFFFFQKKPYTDTQIHSYARYGVTRLYRPITRSGFLPFFEKKILFLSTPSLIFTVGFESNFWFNEPILRAVQTNECNYSTLPNDILSRGGVVGLNLAWRNTFNSPVISDYDLLSQHLQFFNPQMSSSALILNYFSISVRENFPEDRIMAEVDENFGWFSLSDSNISSFKRRAVYYHLPGTFWLTTYLDSGLYSTGFLSRAWPTERILFEANTTSMYWLECVRLINPWYWTAIMLFFNPLLVTMEFWGDWIFFFSVGQGLMPPVKNTGYDANFTLLMMNGLFENKPWRQFPDRPWHTMADLEWISNFGFLWRYFYTKRFGYNTYLEGPGPRRKTTHRRKFFYLPNLYSILDYVSDTPLECLPIDDSWALSFNSNHFKKSGLNERATAKARARLIDGSADVEYDITKDKKYFSRRYFKKHNRFYLGSDSYEKNRFYEKPVFRSIYLNNLTRFSIAARRKSIFFSGFSSLTREPEFEQIAGRWGINFVLHDKFFARYYYRYWAANQSFTFRSIENEKFNLFKLYKPRRKWKIFFYETYAIRKKKKKVGDVKRLRRLKPESTALLSKLRTYKTERMSNRIAFFFKTLRQNFFFSFNQDLSPMKAPQAAYTYDSWLLNSSGRSIFLLFRDMRNVWFVAKVFYFFDKITKYSFYAITYFVFLSGGMQIPPTLPVFAEFSDFNSDFFSLTSFSNQFKENFLFMGRVYNFFYVSAVYSLADVCAEMDRSWFELSSICEVDGEARVINFFDSFTQKTRNLVLDCKLGVLYEQKGLLTHIESFLIGVDDLLVDSEDLLCVNENLLFELENMLTYSENMLAIFESVPGEESCTMFVDLEELRVESDGLFLSLKSARDVLRSLFADAKEMRVESSGLFSITERLRSEREKWFILVEKSQTSAEKFVNAVETLLGAPKSQLGAPKPQLIYFKIPRVIFEQSVNVADTLLSIMDKLIINVSGGLYEQLTWDITVAILLKGSHFFGGKLIRALEKVLISIEKSLISHKKLHISLENFVKDVDALLWSVESFTYVETSQINFEKFVKGVDRLLMSFENLLISRKKSEINRAKYVNDVDNFCNNRETWLYFPEKSEINCAKYVNDVDNFCNNREIWFTGVASKKWYISTERLSRNPDNFIYDVDCLLAEHERWFTACSENVWISLEKYRLVLENRRVAHEKLVIFFEKFVKGLESGKRVDAELLRSSVNDTGFDPNFMVLRDDLIKFFGNAEKLRYASEKLRYESEDALYKTQDLLVVLQGFYKLPDDAAAEEALKVKLGVLKLLFLNV